MWVYQKGKNFVQDGPKFATQNGEDVDVMLF